MAERKKSDLADKFIIRLPEGLRGRIAAAAFENKRSMNAEVVAVLEKAFPEIPGWEEFLDDVDYVIDSYKQGTNERWSREDLRSLLSVVVHQIAHDAPKG